MRTTTQSIGGNAPGAAGATARAGCRDALDTRLGGGMRPRLVFPAPPRLFRGERFVDRAMGLPGFLAVPKA
jgi:hypothetical protein